MVISLNLEPGYVRNPFGATPRHGEEVSWIVRDLEANGDPISGELTHYEAMRVLLRGPDELVMRADADPDLIVTGRSFSSNFASSSPLDVTPALPYLEMQDFVDLLQEDFGPGPASGRVLSLLDQQGDPRAQRLLLYTTLWSTPDEEGRRPEARLQINQDQTLDWLKAHRPDIHDELTYRMAPPGPSHLD